MTHFLFSLIDNCYTIRMMMSFKQEIYFGLRCGFPWLLSGCHHVTTLCHNYWHLAVVASYSISGRNPSTQSLCHCINTLQIWLEYWLCWWQWLRSLVTVEFPTMQEFYHQNHYNIPVTNNFCMQWIEYYQLFLECWLSWSRRFWMRQQL